jgi:pyruvate formate lyase activating enzyme
VIERDWYVMGTYQLTDDGHCNFCGAKIPGVFNGPPGDWGSKRILVNLKEFPG